MLKKENRCVCCGEVIPEGRQVCPICEARAEAMQDDDSGGYETSPVPETISRQTFSDGISWTAKEKNIIIKQ